jgi:hypothetical protein
VEVVARRREDDEVEAGGGLVALAVDVGPSAPEKGLSSVLKSARCGIAVPFG